MIQVKEFIDSDSSYAERKANDFLATLKEEQFVSISYGTLIKSKPDKSEYQRSTILVVYRTSNTGD
ncbi:sporulation protein Cse60 [Paenibacillus doosanensis]|nr:MULTISPECIES: sporulation protein Cse60 [Paenibacillus]MCS7462695.1 sporulation protein Cse60 [Paenibacillus doosanensis]